VSDRWLSKRQVHGLEVIAMDTPATRHHALEDALTQARVWERHFKSGVPTPLLARGRTGQSLADRLAVRITDFAGSMRFVYLHIGWFVLWIVVNGGLLVAIGIAALQFDPFPFGLLTLIVSLEAIFLSTFVMIAQNRQSALADARAEADYAINVRAEAEVARLLHLMEALVAHTLETAPRGASLEDKRQV
jgi:uncharacterized membrane protein